MILTVDAYPQEGILVHYGTKGMQWGVRKAHPSYQSSQQHVDRGKFGKRGVKRINKRLKRGTTHDRASSIERRNQIIKRAALITVGALFTKNLLTRVIPGTLSYIAGHKMAAAGAKAAENLFSNSHGLPAAGAINLVFNSAKNVWE